MINITLGLDISSQSTGYATCVDGKWKRSKKFYGLIKPNTKSSIGEKLTEFKTELTEIITRIKPTLITIEDVFASRNIKTVKTLARFSGVAVQTAYELLGKEPLIVTTSEVRAYLKSGQRKEEAFKFIVDKYKLDWEFNTHNDIADAIALSLYGHNSLLQDSP